jgi:hypothetical protein
MDPRNILLGLLKRLKEHVGENPSRSTWWGDEPAEMTERARSGLGHLGAAVRMANRALKSGDEAAIRGAAEQCPALAQTGLDMLYRYQKDATHRERQSGGQKRGAYLAAAADLRYEKYRVLFWKLVDTGQKEATAKRSVEVQMTKDEFKTLQETFPSMVTISNQMKKRPKNS